MSKLYQASSVVMLALLAVAGTTIAKDYSKHASTGVPASAQAFMREAAAGGLMEVEVGKLAEQQGSETDVKQFGRRMVADHSKANQELQDLASQKDVKLPFALDAKQKAQRDQLAKLSGSAFDRANLKAMTTDHVHDVAAFKKASQTAQDADVRGFASRTLPTLEDHLSEARRVEAQVQKGSGG